MKKPENSGENRGNCICPNCSLFTRCNHDKGEKFFCGTKRSECSMDSTKMCICGGCPVYAANDLEGGYFCINEIR